MYSVAGYNQMIADEVRVRAYSRALQQAVRPDSVVMDLGAGTGILSLLACRYGARKVYAVEPSSAIEIAREAARANGFADRIECIPSISTDIAVSEEADIIVSDLRGTLPLFGRHLPSIIDARRRFLAPAGKLIPKRDLLWAAVVEAPEDYDRLTARWAQERFGFKMDAASQIARSATAHGFVIWFDCVLDDGIEFSNAPGQPVLIYGSGFFPWPTAVALEQDDRVTINVRADLVSSDYVWSWETRIHKNGASSPDAHFHQSTFLGAPLFRDRLQKRGGRYQPKLKEHGRVDLRILQLMDGTRTSAEIVHDVVVRFPSHFPSEQEALTRVADLVEKYSQ